MNNREAVKINDVNVATWEADSSIFNHTENRYIVFYC